MNAVDIIIKKRDSKALTDEEIRFFIDGYTEGKIPDYQAAAWAMAVLCRGMTARETTALTRAMAESGEMVSLKGIADIAVDKHSTGGVGDKTTLIVQPIVTACGLPVAKMSGRGLGFSGGTIDKFESIPGMRLNLSKEEFLNQLKQYGTVLSGQSADLAPADGKLYALRDVTGTVPSIPLIASSIMSKKIAAGTPLILLDVKVGNGAFMETLEKAEKLARLMVSIGKKFGRTVKAELTDMNQPLGYAVGNALEVQEAVRMLRGEKSAPDLYEHCIESSALMIKMGRKAKSVDEARHMAEDAIHTGKALESLKLLVRLQGGDVSYIDDLAKFPKAPIIRDLYARSDGWLSEINARMVGEASVLLGAGRVTKADRIDHRVGIIVHHKVGDPIKKGMPLFTVHANNEEKLNQAAELLNNACKYSESEVEKLPQFYGLIE
ncbi:MAG TPA: thymidine phosphorylase [Flexilinea sp.]|jgi:pyrimidine-nucleoside phosphorylase|nr:thymidine phosphorylase [Flexilinea sp.]HPL57631.1 thymidine phosphorylase [Flexilinea sp.]